MKKIKNTKKVFVCALALGMSASTFVGCGGESVGASIDETKQQIYVYSVDNGMGYRWAETFAEEFNALPENSEYQVVVYHGADNLTIMNTALQAGTTDVNIFFDSNSRISPMVKDNRLIDVSDVYEMTAPGDSKKIREKTIDFQLFKNAYSDLNGNGIYAIPYSTGMSGMVFDYEFFLENGYLNYAATSEKSAVEAQGGAVSVDGNRLKVSTAFGNYKTGDYVLTAGKDGTYGTYDDGQAITEAEFFTMIANIIENDHAPFIFSTNSVEAYVPTVYFGIMAQNMGYENYYNFMTLNGEIKSKTGEVEATLTTATGISAWDTQTVQNAYQASLDFFNRTIIGNVGSINGEQYLPDQMLHKSCVSSISLSHLDAQDNFISAYQSSNIGYSAFLLEGTWWENEAKSAFNELPNDDNGESRKFGEREYRYYLYPTTSTQVTGADKSVLACQDDGCGVLFNNVPAKLKEGITSEDFIQKCKEFLAYTLSDKSLEYYTASTGNPRPFEYDISAENLAKMTPFQRNNLQIIQDTEHISIVYPNIINNVNPIRTFGGFDNYQINSSVKTPWAALKRAQDNPLTVSEYITRITSYAKSNYSSCYDKIKEYVNE